MAFLIDGSWGDIAALGAGGICMLVKPLKRCSRKQRPYFESRSLSVDFLNGATVPTFLLLIGSVLSSKILEETLKSAKLSLGLAGVLGLVFIVREIVTG